MDTNICTTNLGGGYICRGLNNHPDTHHEWCPLYRATAIISTEGVTR